ncbi:hypothetical protein DEO72_LG6g1034 [Vigna unguiculata]|uniref:Transposase n=1 Tax=Vigna unguiculata TaxID=3917 RepID=A0A4D6M4X3_VIGUN|nr:hypothetical protein DEO72_LG6g1034 [Vigna unguiculata]
MPCKRQGKYLLQACSESKTRMEEKDQQVRIVHKCETKYIVEAKNLLKPSHRKRIKVTPFRWCLELGKDEVTAKFSCNGYEGCFTKSVALQEKFEKQERLIMEMKAKIKNLQAKYFGRGDADPPSHQGNYLNEVGDSPSEQKQCDQAQENNLHGDFTTVAESNPCDAQPEQCVQLDDSIEIEENTLDSKECSKSECLAIVPYIEGQTSTMVIDMGILNRDVTTAE